MIDVLVTTHNRVEFLKITLESFFEATEIPFRMFIVDDGSTDGTLEYLAGLRHSNLASVVLSKQRMGVVYGFDQLWNLADFFDLFHSENTYMCYLQDDMRSRRKNWLADLIYLYEELKDRYDVGFFSGYDAPEHPVLKRITMNGGGEVLLKKSSTASNLIAEKSFWRSIGYVPRYNPNGSVRGFPGNGRGSHIDLYLTGCASYTRFQSGAAAPNCSYKQGKYLMVMSGALEHLGQKTKSSTWRQDEKSHRLFR